MSDSISQSLKNILRNLPSEPGVYRMLDSNKVVLYVGKANNLKKRVNSYFSKNQQAVKTRKLVSQIDAVEITITSSETEALLLECNLIKALRPKYNVLMRDDKSYPYIEITNSHNYPSIKSKRSKKRPGSDKDFFGPYPNNFAVRETMNLISKVFKIRTCTDSYFNARSRPCLQYQIGRCSAPCTAYISQKNYQIAVRDTIRFLRGESQQIIFDLQTRMQRAVDNLAFEDAAIIRDQIKNLRYIQEDQAVIKAQGDVDVIVIKVIQNSAYLVLLRIRGGENLGCESFFPSMPEESICASDDEIWQEIFIAFISFYYLDSPSRIPRQIYTDQKVHVRDSLESMLKEVKGSKCDVKTVMRGQALDYISFATKNLNLAIIKQDRSQQMFQDRLSSLAKFLKMTVIKRFECFDVSHTQGNETVASCVVFDETGPVKSAYRRYNIKDIQKGDDYAALYNALTRRFSGSIRPLSKPSCRGKLRGDSERRTRVYTQVHEDSSTESTKQVASADGFGIRSIKELPNVLIIDGGKGQVNVALRVLKELHLTDITILGVAKGRTRKVGMERLIIGDSNHEQTLPEDSPAMHLIQYIRDEAHRFAIASHRNKRQKQSLNSGLESIDGIGSKRRQALLRHFGGLREISKASVAELVKVNGISLSLAKIIYQHFH